MSSTAVPSTGAPVSTTVVGSQRTGEGARALAAGCPAGSTGIAGCTNVKIAGGAVYGPTTPAGQVPGFHPGDLQSAYNLPSATAGSGQTIGIVAVNDDPNLEADLAVYRSTFGLPACSSSSGCLTVLTAKNKPQADVNWAHEFSIDVDMASAICPQCKLVVSEAKSTKSSDLAAAVSAAISAGATVVSNSYAIPETKSESAAAWSHPGVPIVAAAGDQGYGSVDWPAAAPNVIAVGATSLVAAASTARGWTETVWSGTASGCSAYAAKPTWQTDSGCAMRTVADVAAVGDPNTPVAVYDSYQDSGWIQMGGTSVSTPIVAGVYALAANGAELNAASSLYANRSALFAVTGGTNGTCSTAYLCSAGSGYSGPAGLGSPNGIAAF
ncbi:MAG: S8 family serine peptidase [Candidatus Velthaea sp.]